ncbi:MAG: lamin tail domain-containing protein [Anaerolineales bacterium]|nr:lamin tail domain-containing protein [Anaerolineales bacterium]
MNKVRNRKIFWRGMLLVLLALIGGSTPARVAAVGEAATQFGVYIPPSAVLGRMATLIVTAVQEDTQVDIVDESADDGDSDDSRLGLTLDTGQSYIVYIIEGSINDDGTGANAKKDGDFFRVTASRPVLVANLTVNTDWQHDFVPADNRRMSGTSFYLYRPAGLTTTHNNNELLNIFAYNDNTDIQILDITATPKISSGQTTVVSDAEGVNLLTATLQAGQDLMTVAGIKPTLDPGHTFHIISNKDITVMFGALGKGRAASRDGGAYVPGKNGYSADKTFYFVIPNQTDSERELRLVSYAQPANVTLRGWSVSAQQWNTISTFALPVYGHAELVGSALGSGYYFFEVTSDAIISVFETNWLETGSYGTSDLGTYISAEDGTGAGTYFQAYMGPPSTQPDGAKLSHVVVAAHETAHVRFYDSDSYGEYIELYNPTSQTINLEGWQITNAEGWAMTLPAGLSVGAGQTFLLEFHQKATEITAGYVYGTAYPKFKLDNGHDTLVLSHPDGTYADMLAYTDTDWFSHGVYHALERKNPNLPFEATNAQNSPTPHEKTSNNLGDYYGTPGVPHGPAGNGSGNLVINEVMTGRIYRAETISPNFYTKLALTTTEWEGINNGELPGNASTNPENPYLIVESDTPVSVMVSNWNDNWMTFSNGTLRPDPAVSYVADYYQREPGQTVVFTAYIENHYVSLQNPITTLTLPPGLDYTPGSYQTPAQLAGLTPSEIQQPDGTWLLTWVHPLPLAADDVYRFQAWGELNINLPDAALLQSTARTVGTDTGGVNTYASQDTLVVSVGLAEQTAITDVVINEVASYPACGNEWIELHNRSTSAVDLSGWELADEDGFIYRFPALTFIPNDGYLTIYLGNGTNTPTDLYTGQDFAGALHDHEDQVSLYTNSVHTVATLVDFVQWDNNGTLSEPGDDTLAANAGQWNNDTVVPAPTQGTTIGRDRTATDQNLAADWENSGGPDAAVGTAGAINVTIPGADVTPPDPVTGLIAEPQIGQEGVVNLTWSNPIAGDFAGVRVVRSLDDFPLAMNDGVVVYDGIGQSLTETGLPAGAPVFYAAFAYDDSGNTACVMQSAQVAALPPQSIHLVYEDLKGTGWVDWDTNDLIVRQDSALQLGAEGIEQIEINFEAEARGSFYDHVLNLSVEIGGWADVLVERYDAQGTLLASETSRQNDFVDVIIFDTYQAMPGNHPNGTANVMAGVPRQPGMSVRVTITLDAPASNPLKDAHLPPFDPWIEVLNTGQHIHLMQAGGIGNSQSVWDSTSPLHGRDLPLALSFNQVWAWPLENHPLWEAYPQYTTYITSGGTLNQTWFTAPNSAHLWTPTSAPGALTPSPARDTSHPTRMTGPPAVSGPLVASPLLVDLHQDGSVELLATAMDGYLHIWQTDGTPLPGWPQALGGSSRSAPAVGDLDGDGLPEIVVGSDSAQLFAWHADGTLVAGFPVNVEGSVKSSPALANLDADPGLEIVFATSAPRVYVLDGAGTSFDGWPRTVGGVPESYGNYLLVSTPAVGDLTGDGIPEIVAGSTDGRVYAWQLDGSFVSSFWPRATHDWVYASPVIVDLNGDGYRDVLVASGDGRLYAWTGNGFELPGFPIRVRGGLVASPAVVDLDGDNDLEIVFASVLGKVYAVQHDGSPVSGWPRKTEATIYSSPVIGDLDGDGDLEVVVGSHAGLVFAWHHDGIPVVDWPRQAGDWITGAPALGDFDNDGLLEVAAAAYDGQVYLWNETGTYLPENQPWPAFHGGATHTGLVETDVPIQPLPPVYTYYLPVLQQLSTAAP